MAIPEYLYHYYELKNGPFRNITELGIEKAIDIQRKISDGWNSRRPPNYIDLRFGLEKRLKEQFISKGGNLIETTHFTSPWENANGRNLGT